MPVPITYRKSGEQGIASYNYTDLAEGTGVVNYYCVKSVSSEATTYMLTTLATPFPGNSGKFVSSHAVNFDLSPFNLPKVVKGTAIITGMLGFSATTFQARAQIKKVSKGGTVTSISSEAATQDISADTQTFCVKMPLVTTNFGKGDTLRLVFRTTGNNSGDYVAIDPLKTWLTTSEPLKLAIPYKIDL